MTDTNPLTPAREQEIRQQVVAALSIAGAFCGECGFEPGDVGCSDCRRCHAMYADAVLPILRAELAARQSRAEVLRDFLVLLEHSAGDGVVENLLAHNPDLEQLTAATEKDNAQPDTLPAWLYQRFSRSRTNAPSWSALTEEDQSYWEHEARAVQRAVARGGFKTT